MDDGRGGGGELEDTSNIGKTKTCRWENASKREPTKVVGEEKLPILLIVDCRVHEKGGRVGSGTSTYCELLFIPLHGDVDFVRANSFVSRPRVDEEPRATIAQPSVWRRAFSIKRTTVVDLVLSSPTFNPHESLYHVKGHSAKYRT